MIILLDAGHGESTPGKEAQMGDLENISTVERLLMK